MNVVLVVDGDVIVIVFLVLFILDRISADDILEKAVFRALFPHENRVLSVNDIHDDVGIDLLGAFRAHASRAPVQFFSFHVFQGNPLAYRLYYL